VSFPSCAFLKRKIYMPKTKIFHTDS